MKRVAAVGLGSNLESKDRESRDRESKDRESQESQRSGGLEANLREAVERVRGLGEIQAVSSFYETEPVGYVDQPRFLNGALLVETELEPLELMRGLLEVERSMGRDRVGSVAKGPRVIDLDLLLYGDRVVSTAELTLPHPEMQARRFVLEPLAEIAPGMVHPVLGVTVGEMLARLAG
jgi:2-amino-4-hydroxy-6-hydroxymethyldihydropteridine diphosphokinase